jgi:Flp pilus assembly protein TadD
MALSENRNGPSLDLKVAEQAYGRGELQLAGHTCSLELSKDPDNIEALLLMAKVLMDTEKSPIALALGEKVTRLAPKDWRGWLLRGMCEASLLPDSPMASLLKAEKLSPDNSAILRSMAFAYVTAYDFEKAESYARKAIPLENHPQGHVALGFALLHREQWGEGWDEYAYGMGHQAFREKQDWGIPDWNGEEGTLLVYAEQGLGDQIAYCSTLPDANVVQLVCHPKLKNTFEGTFDCEVHGDQFKREIDWDVRADFAVSMSGLQRWYRRKREDFRGSPFLKPHPGKQFQWKALLRALGKRPKIGIAWTGGMVGAHGWYSRNVTLETMLPVMQAFDADFISLEYKDRSEEIQAFQEKHGITVHDFPWGTQTDNYEDTVALISVLDAVVCVPTTAYHAAGALGVPAVVMVHDTPHFHECTPWWASVQFLDRTDDYITKVIERLRQCESLSG